MNEKMTKNQTQKPGNGKVQKGSTLENVINMEIKTFDNVKECAKGIILAKQKDTVKTFADSEKLHFETVFALLGSGLISYNAIAKKVENAFIESAEENYNAFEIAMKSAINSGLISKTEFEHAKAVTKDFSFKFVFATCEDQTKYNGCNSHTFNGKTCYEYKPENETLSFFFESFSSVENYEKAKILDSIRAHKKEIAKKGSERFGIPFNLIWNVSENKPNKDIYNSVVKLLELPESEKEND